MSSNSPKALGRHDAPTVDRPRVLTLTRSYPNNVTGGLGLWIERPTVRLNASCDMTVVSPVPYCPPVPRLQMLEEYRRFRDVAHSEVRRGVEVHHPRFIIGPGDTLYRHEARAYERAVLSTVEELHARSPFDLIHAHFIYPDGVVAHRLSERYGVPFVVSEHAPWIPWLERPGIRRPSLDAARAASRILAVSSAVRESILSYVGLSDHVEVVPILLDEDVFYREDSIEIKSDQVLFVGLLNFNKGVDVLLDAMQELRAAGVESRLLLVGGSFYRRTRLQGDALRAYAQRLDLGDRVSFLGPQPPHAVASLMRESAVVVLPSHVESFGSVLIEALACGTPVVATSSGGPEDIVNEQVGLLVPPGDKDALARAIADVLGDRERYSPTLLAEYARERFGDEAVVDRTREIYAEVAPRFAPTGLTGHDR